MDQNQGTGKDVPRATNVGPRKMGNPGLEALYSGYLWIISYNPQESLENTINTMGTRTLGVHPIVSWQKEKHQRKVLVLSTGDVQHTGHEQNGFAVV